MVPGITDRLKFIIQALDASINNPDGMLRGANIFYKNTS